MRLYFSLLLTIWILVSFDVAIKHLPDFSFDYNPIKKLGKMVSYPNFIFLVIQFIPACVMMFWKRFRTKLFKVYMSLSFTIITTLGFFPPYKTGKDFFYFIMLVSYLVSIFYLFVIYKMSKNSSANLSEAKANKHINNN